jgi:hypothetical protein
MFPLVPSTSQGQPVWIYCNSRAFVLTPNRLLDAPAAFVTLLGGVATPLPSVLSTSSLTNLKFSYPQRATAELGNYESRPRSMFSLSFLIHETSLILIHSG